MQNIRLCILLFVSVLAAASVCAQNQKYERESRLPTATVPAPALAFIQKLPIATKIKWYKEEQLDRYSVEAKFKWNKRKYSIEFDSTGRLEDIEIQLASKAIPAAIKSNMSKALDNAFSCFCVQKIQIQYTGTPHLLSSLVFGNDIPPTTTTIRTIYISYELIVKAKKERYPARYEVTFSQAGELRKVTKIISKNADNLEY